MPPVLAVTLGVVGAAVVVGGGFVVAAVVLMAVVVVVVGAGVVVVADLQLRPAKIRERPNISVSMK